MKKVAPIFLWITDPWETLDPVKESTLLLLKAAGALGKKSYWSDVRSIRWEQKKVLLVAYELFQTFNFRTPTSTDARTLDITKFKGQIHYRPDPPINEAYLQPLRLLLLAHQPKKNFTIVNPPELLFQGSEKLLPLHAGLSTPPTIVSSEWEKIRAFATNGPRAVVLKTLHQAQSKGVEKWTKDQSESELHETAKRLSVNFHEPILVQTFIPSIETDGEMRLWFANTRFLASAKKYPLKGDFRIQIDQGSKVEAATLTAPQKRLIPKIEKVLKEKKIKLAAVDLLGTDIIDFNFTSPGLLYEMEKVTQRNLSREIIQSLLK